MQISQGERFRPITITLSSKEEVNDFLEIIRFNSTTRPAKLRKLSKEITSWFAAKLKQPIEDEMHHDFVHRCGNKPQDANVGQWEANNYSDKLAQSEPKITPMYFVMHIDGSLSVADPQPLEPVVQPTYFVANADGSFSVADPQPK